MISVLIPTRKRVRMLDRLLHSIWNMSSSEDAVEVLLRCDEDDRETIDYLEGIKSQNHNLQVLVGPRKDGYKSIPSYMNDMAAVAKGNILMCCNDDVIFRTKNWDRIVENIAVHYTDGIFDIGVNSILNAQFFVFSIVSRQWFDIVGYLINTRILWWGKFFKDISDAFGRSPYVPEIVVEHDWAGYYSDVTNAEAQKWLSEIVLDASGWRDEYQRLHDKAVAEVIEKLKPHFNPSIKPIIPARGICIRFEKMKPIVNLKYVHIAHDMDKKPRLFTGRVIDIMDNKPQLFIGRVIDIPKPRPRPRFYPRILAWLESKPVIKSGLIRIGARFIVEKIPRLTHL